MKYKIILLILTSIALHAIDDDARAARIKELEQLQSEYEARIADVNYKLLKDTLRSISYKSMALQCWDDSEEKFTKFMKKFTKKYAEGKDFERVFEQKSLGQKYGEASIILFLKVALQTLYLEKMSIQFYQLTDELHQINRELNSLKA